MPPLDPHVAAKMGTLQLMDDAITYRQNRLTLPCPDCAPARRCDEHAADEQLITRYQGLYSEALRDALTGAEPRDITLIMQPGDDTPPTAAALSLVILTRLRELAATGPAITELDGRRVIIELDDQGKIAEYPLPEDTDCGGAA